MDVNTDNPKVKSPSDNPYPLDNPQLIHSAVSLHGAPPLKNVVVIWPLVIAALQEFGIDTPNTRIVAAATIKTETGIFYPIYEKLANPQTQPHIYEQQQRYYPSGYYGRGIVQTTWEKNYLATGQALKLDLIKNPNLLLDPKNSARALAWYFKDRRMNISSDAGNWELTRKQVNGGTNGLPEDLDYINALLKLVY